MAGQEVPYWDAFRDTAIGKYLLDHEQSFIAEHLQPVPRPFCVLEIGSCAGRVTMPLRDSTDVVIIGLDVDFRALTLFQGRPGNHPAVVAHALQLPFAPERFDTIVAIQCLRYFDPVEFLQSCHRVLKPDGWLFLQAVNQLSYKKTMKRLVRRYAKRDPNILTATQWVELLTNEGFDVRSVRGYNWVPFTPKVTRMSNSRLISYAARFEKSLHLQRLYRISPWILVAARRSTEPAASLGSSGPGGAMDRSTAR
jgi:SAM-dependent methyltransferase